jgi:hypothetical protein
MNFMSEAPTKTNDEASSLPTELDPSADLEDELRPEYDASVLKNGVRGKYLEAYRSGTNLVLLAPDVAKAFPTEETVNEGLRRLMQLRKAA